jgi:hypothetical protein
VTQGPARVRTPSRALGSGAGAGRSALTLQDGVVACAVNAGADLFILVRGRAGRQDGPSGAAMRKERQAIC